MVATGIDNAGTAHEMQPAESTLTELAGKLRNDSRRIADRIERSAPLPLFEGPPLRPTARHPEAVRQIRIRSRLRAAPQGLDPYGRPSAEQIPIETN